MQAQQSLLRAIAQFAFINCAILSWSASMLRRCCASDGTDCQIFRGDRELRPLLGLAWDCGTLATGVVSVPVLLALGIGVMKTQKEKRKAAEEEAARKKGEQHRESEAAANALEGFGMITLARFSPVPLFVVRGHPWATNTQTRCHLLFRAHGDGDTGLRPMTDRRLWQFDAGTGGGAPGHRPQGAPSPTCPLFCRAASASH